MHFSHPHPWSHPAHVVTVVSALPSDAFCKPFIDALLVDWTFWHRACWVQHASEHQTIVTIAMQVNSEFQAFKHIESVGKGELMKATRPLEVTLAVYPTLVLTNALPYDMDIVVWQV